jgi:photosystem II stability/assembly factor-like uncharacterized protein
MWSKVFKVNLIAVMVLAALCVSLSIVNAQDEDGCIESPVTYTLTSVYVLSSTNAWAVGDVGTIIHWDGTSWTTVTSPTTNPLLSIWMVGASDGWAVGAAGTIIRWDGTSWTTVTSPTTSVLYDVFVNTASDGWAVGDAGTIIRWDGTSWTNAPTSTTLTLRSVFYCGDRGFSVGAQGEILYIAPGGTQWIPEFPTAIFVLLLLILTSIAGILAKTASKKRRSHC